MSAVEDELRRQLKEERDRVSESYKQIGHLEAQLGGAQKLSSIVFARWILEVFKKEILTKCTDEHPLKSTPKIKEAWLTFFIKPPTDLKIVRDRMAAAIEENASIKVAVDKLNDEMRKGNRPGTFSSIDWFMKRGQNLYWILSSCLHDISKINWLTSPIQDLLIQLLPDFTACDKELLNIVYSEVEPFTLNPNVVDSAVSF